MVFTSLFFPRHSYRHHHKPFSSCNKKIAILPAPSLQMPTSDRMMKESNNSTFLPIMENNNIHHMDKNRIIFVPVVDNIRICRTLRCSFQQRKFD